jgi:hypothetical protein
MVLHTFGQYLVDFHLYLHALVADGLFDDLGVFHPLPEDLASCGRWKRCFAAGSSLS